MYKTNLIVILLFFFLFSNAQEKDTICGKIKSLREELKFVNDSIQNRKLFSTEGDYGHYGFSSAEFTKSRFKSWWYDTYWVHYVNYYKEFDKSDRLLKEVWFYKNQDTVNYNEYEYNSSGKTKNRKYISYQESNSSYTYDIKNNLIFVKTISIDSSYSTEKYKYNEMDLVSPIFIPETALSKPGIISPAPTVKLIGSPLSYELSNVDPSLKVPL